MIINSILMNITHWLLNNYIELFGAVAGIIYVFLEIRQTIWLWPVGIITSAVYILVFLESKFYADMSLQVYYLVISVMGWYWWRKGTGHTSSSEALAKEEGVGLKKEGGGEGEKRRGGEGENGRKGEWEKGRIGEGETLQVTRIDMKTGVVLAIVFVILYLIMRVVLKCFTDSPVPEWDSFITSLSIVATWMLARKIYEHWFLWIIVNFVSVGLFLVKGLYPTVILYAFYGIMSFVGLSAWKSTIKNNSTTSKG
jgi:nicotinamide mononucleotide transporter